MAKVSLRIYSREIEKLIEQNRLDEAIAHCRHILTAFPKHLETYRLLGKAYLEAKRYAEAVDIFQRILVSVPDDFVSHVGMSIISDEQNKLDDAIWHMERAFEVQPSNAAIQGELQRLFCRRDGVEPPKIRLTRGALAQMYVQGELYNQAISEIKAVLASDAQRTDMQVLLAKAYFRNEQKTDASDICSQLLQRFPYCYDANRVMVELLPGTQRAESTQVYRHRVSELDPYAAFAQESIFRSNEVPDAAVSLERFEYTGPVSDSASSWGGEMGIGLESDATDMGASVQQPDWLKAAAPSGTSASIEAAPASQSQVEIPDFLRQAGWGESQLQQSPASFEGESESSGAVQADLPDWVKAMAPTTGASAAVSTPEARPAALADTPDWLRNLGGDQASVPESAPAPESNSAADTNSNAWLKELGAPAAAEPEPAVPQAFDDIPAWLKNSDDQNAAPVSQPVASQPAPDWVDQAKAIGETPVAAQPASSSTDETGMWLRNLEQSESKGDVSENNASTPKESPDWLSELSGADTYTDITDAPAKEEPPILGSDSAPAWLSEPGPAPSEPKGARKEDVPDWLAGLDTEENALQAGSGSDLPSWLQDDSEPEIRQPASPADWHPAETQESAEAVEDAPSPNKPPVSESNYAFEESLPDKKSAAKPEKKSPAAPHLKQTSALMPRSVDSLVDAQTELERGNISTAVAVYDKLIRKGKFLEEIIRDLRDALYRYPVEVPIWQALGDAYMRGSRLQEALDAYTKAEELLR